MSSRGHADPLQNSINQCSCLLEVWMRSVLSTDKSRRAHCNPATVSSVWTVVFWLCLLNFSLWLKQICKKIFSILYLSVPQMLSWMWRSATKQAAVMLTLKVLLFSIGVFSSCSIYYEHPTSQCVPATPCRQAIGWIDRSLVKFGRDRWHAHTLFSARGRRLPAQE